MLNEKSEDQSFYKPSSGDHECHSNPSSGCGDISIKKKIKCEEAVGAKGKSGDYQSKQDSSPENHECLCKM